MEIKIGGRYKSVGRNMTRFECVVDRIKQSSNHTYPMVFTTCGAKFNVPFFKNNFELIEEKEVSEFKVGDTVEVNFKGTIETVLDNTVVVKHEIEAVNFQTTTRNITLLEREKPDLAVGQVWISACQFERKVLAIHDKEVAFLNLYTNKMHVIDKDQFVNEFSNTLKEK